MKSYKRFLNYSYEPFRLNFCGPQDEESEKIVNDYLLGKKISPKRLDKVIEQFVGVYPYLKLIAQKNNLDPLDEQVIEAYWIGNNLLKEVTAGDLRKLIMENFIGQGRLGQTKGKELAANVPHRAVAHHSFHVLYVGSVTETVHLAGKLLDLCRISWGRVVGSRKSSLDFARDRQVESLIIVKYRPLIINPNEVRLSRDEVEKEIKWNQKVLPKVIDEQWVSFHWNLAGEVLTEDQVRNLEKYTLRNIEALARRE